MGTHCAMIVKDAGSINRWERTMDGGMLIDAFIEWTRDPQPNTYPDPYKIGTGDLQLDSEGEGNQEYGLILDHTTKRFGVACGIDEAVYDAITRLKNQGWSFLPNDDELWVYINFPDEMI